MVHRFSSRRVALLALATALVATVLGVHLSARGVGASRCERFEAASAQRAGLVTGSGREVVVIGDSWSVGLGLESPADAWPTRLAGRVSVAGFSGSGFSAQASVCGEVSFAARAGVAVDGADLVVVQGGLNDHDQPSAEIRAGFRALMAELGDAPVVVVGPATAPSRAGAVRRVDRLLSRLARRHGAAYVRTSGWSLSYLPDDLHLTATGHRAFGDRVARHLP